MEHSSIFIVTASIYFQKKLLFSKIVTASITIHKEPNTIAAIVVSNNGILGGINHIVDIRILFQDNSFCFLALLSHKLRPGKLIATYKCTSSGGSVLATISTWDCNLISEWKENCLSTRQNVKTKSYGNWGGKEYWAGRPIEDGTTWLQAFLVQVLRKMWKAYL